MSSTEDAALEALAAAVAPRVLRLLLKQARAPKPPDGAVDDDAMTRDEVLALLNRLGFELDT